VNIVRIFIFLLSLALGLFIGIITVGNNKIYQFYTDNKAFGFACVCEQQISWKGNRNDGCGGGFDHAIALYDNTFFTGGLAGLIMPNSVLVPDGACCKSEPRVGTTTIRDLINRNPNTPGQGNSIIRCG
jgi:hypothetical protein